MRKYIEGRKRFDQEFATFAKISSRVELCKRLSAEFGWTVDYYALGRNINRNSDRNVRGKAGWHPAQQT